MDASNSRDSKNSRDASDGKDTAANVRLLFLHMRKAKLTYRGKDSETWCPQRHRGVQTLDVLPILFAEINSNPGSCVPANFARKKARS